LPAGQKAEGDSQGGYKTQMVHGVSFEAMGSKQVAFA
jgi:hypothetical protein